VLTRLPQRLRKPFRVRLYWGELAPVVGQELADPEREERQALLEEVRGAGRVLALVDRQERQARGPVNRHEAVAPDARQRRQVEAVHVDEAGAVLLELALGRAPLRAVCLLRLPRLPHLRQAADLVAHQHPMHRGALGVRQRDPHGVHQIVEGQALLSQGEDQGLLGLGEGVGRLLGLATPVLRALPVPPGADGGGGDGQLAG